MKARRYTTEAEIIAEIDRLKDEIPALHQMTEAAEKECKEYFDNIEDHLSEYTRKVNAKIKVFKKDWPYTVHKELKNQAIRAARAPVSQEDRIKKLADALSEFRTNRMPFLQDESVEVK